MYFGMDSITNCGKQLGTTHVVSATHNVSKAFNLKLNYFSYIKEEKKINFCDILSKKLKKKLVFQKANTLASLKFNINKNRVSNESVD